MSKPAKKIYIIAGEPSGDFIGCYILRKLKSQSVKIFGVGGPLMESEGLTSLFDIVHTSVGGLIEVIPHIFKIKKLMRKTVNDIIDKEPDIVLTIDSPGFCFNIAKVLRKHKLTIRLIHVVAPSVWAWRPGRAKKLVKLYDKLLTLFEFEPIYFTKYGMDAECIGHPAMEVFAEKGKTEAKEEILLLMPGSRSSEIKKMLPIFVEASRGYEAKRVIIPTLKHLVPLVNHFIKNRNIEVISDESEKIKLYKKAKLAFVASGTATLQLAVAGCPMIVCYKLNKLTYLLLKLFVKTKYISLVNIVLNKMVVPELIQDYCNIGNIKNEIKKLEYQDQIKHFKLIQEKVIKNNNLVKSILN
ncbi:MAG: lipid-A-disaccharide synthase [Holosporales bacterium]|jgi:lipid-A-disaccharide synthase|nr:lipid-A-disaccharide synthase [Holosporales bacterium]